MTENEPVMVVNNLFAKANNGHKFMFIGGIATKYYFWVITGSFLSITVQNKKQQNSNNKNVYIIKV